MLLATVAAYGLALLLLFVNRSHPFNLCHPMVPFAVVLTALVFNGMFGADPNRLAQPQKALVAVSSCT